MSYPPPEIVREIIRVAPFRTFCLFMFASKEYYAFCKSIVRKRIKDWVILTAAENVVKSTDFSVFSVFLPE